MTEQSGGVRGWPGVASAILHFAFCNLQWSLCNGAVPTMVGPLARALSGRGFVPDHGYHATAGIVPRLLPWNAS